MLNLPPKKSEDRMCSSRCPKPICTKQHRARLRAGVTAVNTQPNVLALASARVRLVLEMEFLEIGTWEPTA